MTARPVGALALRVASDALSHDAALKPEWKVPAGLRKDMERAADDLRALIARCEAAEADKARVAAQLEEANAGYLRVCAERNDHRRDAERLAEALQRIANLTCCHDAMPECPREVAKAALRTALAAHRAGGGK